MDFNSALGLGIVISLQDKVSAGLEAIRTKMLGFQSASDEMVKTFDAGIRQIASGFASISMGNKILGSFSHTFNTSIQTALRFEQSMARVKAVSGATGETFQALEKQAEDLGRDTQFSASQAAYSQELLARAGFRTNEIIAAMPGLLDMAASEGMDLANAADIAAGTLRGFGLEADEMYRVANVLAKTSATTNTSIATLGESFKYVAADAAVLKMPFEEVAAVIGILGNASIKGSQAGTYLRAALGKLISPTKKGQAAIASLGLELFDEQGELRSFNNIMQQFSEKMQGMSGAERKAILGEIFDTRSSTGMMAVLSQFEKGVLSEETALLQKVSDEAHQMAGIMNNTAQGGMKRLESATEALRIAIGKNLLPVYTAIINKVAEFKAWLAQLIKEHPILTKAVITLATALTALASSFFIVMGSFSMLGGFITIWPVIQKSAVVALTNVKKQILSLFNVSYYIARLRNAFSSLAAPVFTLILLAGALYIAWAKNLWGIQDMARAVSEGFNLVVIASKEGIAEIDEALYNELQEAGIWDFVLIMGKLFWRLRQFWEGLCEGFSEGVGYIKNIFKAIRDAFKSTLTPVIDNGKELLVFLGILKPLTDNQASSWKAWGQLIGRFVPIILSVIAAFKGLFIIQSILGMFRTSFTGLYSFITKHPILAAILAITAAFIYVYAHWEELKQKFQSGIDIISKAFNGFINLDKWGAFLGLIASFIGTFYTIQRISSLISLKGIISSVENLSKLIKGAFSIVVNHPIIAIIAVIASAVAYLYFNWDKLDNRIKSGLLWFVGIAGTVLSAILAFKKIAVIIGIIKAISSVVAVLNAVLLANPVILIIMAIIGAIALLYIYWDDVVAFFVKSWNYISEVAGKAWDKISSYIFRVANWVKQKWQGFKAWWDSWTIADIFAPVASWASSIKNRIVAIWQNFIDWWDSWTLSDIFRSVIAWAMPIIKQLYTIWTSFKTWWSDTLTLKNIFEPLLEWCEDILSKIKNKWQDFKDWLSNLNPFNWSKDTAPKKVAVGNFNYDIGGDRQAANAFDALNSFSSIPELPVSNDVKATNTLITNNKEIIRERENNIQTFTNTTAPAVNNINIAPISGDIIPVFSPDIQVPVPANNISEIIRENNTVTTATNTVKENTEKITSTVPAETAKKTAENVQQNIIDTSLTGDKLNNTVEEINRKISAPVDNSMNKTPLSFTSSNPRNIQSQDIPAAKYIYQNEQNKAATNVNATQNANKQADTPINVNNKVEVKADVKPADVYLDGQKIGSFAFQWIERQNLRSGIEAGVF